MKIPAVFQEPKNEIFPFKPTGAKERLQKVFAQRDLIRKTIRKQKAAEVRYEYFSLVVNN